MADDPTLDRTPFNEAHPVPKLIPRGGIPFTRPLLLFKRKKLAISPLCRWLRRHPFLPPPNKKRFARLLRPNLSPSALFPRALDKYVDCSDDQQRKIGQGFADAATLARWTSDHPIDLTYAVRFLSCLLLH